jgi:hypothetical protein
VEVRLQEPLDGRAVLAVVGHAVRPGTARPVLRLPRTPDLPDGDRDSFLAVRLTGLAADGVPPTGAVDYPAEPLMKEFALPEFDWDAGPLARTVRRAPQAATAELRPNLLPVPPFAAGPSEVVVTVGRRVTYEGLMRAADSDTAVVEFDPPSGTRLTDVRGASLAGWGQAGGRVQAWFRQPTAAAIRWSAEGNADLIPPAGLPPDGAVVELAWPRWPAAVAATAEPIRATVRAAAGFELIPADGPPAVGAAGEFTLTLEPGKPVGRFRLKPSVVKPTPPPKPKAIDPPPRPDPAPAPTAVFDPPLAAEPVRAWPTGVVAWCGAFGLVLWLLRFGSRWRPECAAGVGVLSAAAVGWSSECGLLLLAAAAAGVLARVRRLAC